MTIVNVENVVAPRVLDFFKNYLRVCQMYMYMLTPYPQELFKKPSNKNKKKQNKKPDR